MKLKQNSSYCIICSQQLQLYYEDVYDDRYGFSEIYDLLKCPNCNQYQTIPLLDESYLSTLYSIYYPRKNIDVVGINKQAKQITSIFSPLIRWWKGDNNQGQYYAKRGENVLDYGCGNGTSLVELRLIGANAYGIEADQNVRQVIMPLDLNIHIGALEPNTFNGIKFDLIILNQVLEHIPNPDALLKSLSSHLNANGRIILSFPNSNSFFANFFKRKWINWHIPYHLHHFNLGSSSIYFNNLGWDIKFKKTITPNLWTIIQCKTYLEDIHAGEKSNFWSTFIVSKCAKKKESISESIICFVSHNSSNRAIYFLISCFNRIIDFLGLGDSILICISKK